MLKTLKLLLLFLSIQYSYTHREAITLEWSLDPFKIRADMFLNSEPSCQPLIKKYLQSPCFDETWSLRIWPQWFDCTLYSSYQIAFLSWEVFTDTVEFMLKMKTIPSVLFGQSQFIMLTTSIKNKRKKEYCSIMITRILYMKNRI